MDLATSDQVGAKSFDIPVGRMAVCADPQGAMFNLFQLPDSDD